MHFDRPRMFVLKKDGDRLGRSSSGLTLVLLISVEVAAERSEARQPPTEKPTRVTRNLQDRGRNPQPALDLSIRPHFA